MSYNMPYNAPFMMLSDDDVKRLKEPVNSKFKNSYIDVLSILHDLLCEYSNNPQHAMFEEPDFNKIRTVTDALKRLSESLFYNIQANSSIAFDLHEESRSLKRVTLEVARSLVDKYLDCVIDQYQVLRKN